MLLICFDVSIRAQKTVDKTVATVSDGFQTELITLSDLRWQMALQPGTRLNPASSDDLNLALQKMIDERLFALEAKRVHRNAVSDNEIAVKIKEILAFFPTSGEFESRLREVGFSSVNDENFIRLISDRIAIEKFIDFRFASFIVITPKDEEAYYRNTFVADFRRRFPGLLMPTLDEKRTEINSILRQERIAADIVVFLDDAKRRVSVVVLSPV
ncbi:MAG: hypothetical protein ACRD6X_00910 [Pyrinomonadaceae bacterium]